VDYYTKRQGLEKEPKLPSKLAGPLHKVIMSTNLNPVKVGQCWFYRNRGVNIITTTIVITLIIYIYIVPFRKCTKQIKAIKQLKAQQTDNGYLNTDKTGQ